MKKEKKQPEGGLLQSEHWANVLRAEGKKIIDISSNNELIFGVEQKLPIVGSYVYFLRTQDIDEEFVEKILQLKYGWVRLDVSGKKDLTVLKKSAKKIVPAPHDMQSREHLIIDITKSEEDLLAQMKSKTRYNIRLAQKKGVKVFASKEKKYIDAFYALVTETAGRKDVTFHTKDHYEKIIRGLSHDVIDLYIAEYEGEVIAANLVSFYGGVATYMHGATADVHRNVMAPFLLQWQIMQDAKERECVWYDLGGIFLDSDDAGKKGITRFKKGFAPKEEVYSALGSYDIILSPWRYYLYRVLQKIRK